MLSPGGAFLLSNTFFDRKVGFLLSGAYSKRHLFEEGFSTVRWDNSGATSITVDDLDREEVLRLARSGIAAGRLPPATGRRFAWPGERGTILESRLGGTRKPITLDGCRAAFFLPRRHHPRG